MSDPATLLPVIAPEFAGVDLPAAIEVADMQIAPGLCGDKRPLLVAYLAAHILTIGKRKGTAGGVSSVKEGNLAISYSGASGSAGDSLGATSYGAEYDRLSRGCAFAARTRVARV